VVSAADPPRSLKKLIIIIIINVRRRDGVEVLIAVVNVSVFWNELSCDPPKVIRRFERKFRLHLHG
jgi:hypothetical protein